MRLVMLLVMSLSLFSSVGKLSAQDFGTLISRTQMQAQFLAFDKADTNRFILKTQNGSSMRLYCALPDLRCFLASHASQDLRVRYSTYEASAPSGDAQRTLVATEILSLKTGENLKDWPQREATDSTFAARNHEFLTRFLKNPNLVR
jgi:hypothetical protein